MKLKELIEQGENKTLELKEKLDKTESIYKPVIAFSNSAGGRIIIGVSNKREIVGIDPNLDIFELKDKVASIIHDKCRPTIVPEIFTAQVDNKIILVIEVNRGSLLPYFISSEGKENGVYLRVGATNRKASFENIAELERQRNNLGYDEEVNKAYEFDNLDLTPLINRFALIGKILTIAEMKTLKLVSVEHGKNYPTNGLLILLGVLDHVTIKCSRFKGNTMEVFIDSKEYRGDIFTQLEYAEIFIKNHISHSSEIKSLQRIDSYEIPSEAIRESLVNAVAHRDYSNTGRDIKIGIYDDAINIVSPGGFPSTITEVDIVDGRSEIRNKVVARVLKELKYIEQWGSGIPRIKASCLSRGLAEPQIREKQDFVDVELYRQNSIFKSKASDVSDLSNQEEIIVDYLNENDEITTHQVEELLEIKQRRARIILNSLIQKERVINIGSTNTSKYRLKTK